MAGSYLNDADEIKNTVVEMAGQISYAGEKQASSGAAFF